MHQRVAIRHKGKRSFSCRRPWVFDNFNTLDFVTNPLSLPPDTDNFNFLPNTKQGKAQDQEKNACKVYFWSSVTYHDMVELKFFFVRDVQLVRVQRCVFLCNKMSLCQLCFDMWKLVDRGSHTKACSMSSQQFWIQRMVDNECFVPRDLPLWRLLLSAIPFGLQHMSRPSAHKSPSSSTSFCRISNVGTSASRKKPSV